MDENIKKDLYDLNYSQDFSIDNFQEQNIDIKLENSLPQTATITGEVKDSNNNIVEGATIKLFDSNGKPYLHTIQML